MVEQQFALGVVSVDTVAVAVDIAAVVVAVAAVEKVANEKLAVEIVVIVGR